MINVRGVGAAAAIASLLVTALLAGCDRGDSSVPTTTGVTPSGSSDPTAAASPAVGASPSPSEYVIDDLSSQDDARFQTPSGNIFCAIEPYGKGRSRATLRCDVHKAAWKLPPRPKDCIDVDWFTGIEMTRTASVGVCAGDTVADPDVRKIAYGSGIRYRDITCRSAQTGLTCTNDDTRAAFTVSRERYRIVAPR